MAAVILLVTGAAVTMFKGYRKLATREQCRGPLTSR